ncbi:39S ribosomal protein L35, mitochondrial isoform X2 [Stegostoma tigrinum]|uniref:39S ribosomal protein L35, mitochondrial isoform X2 n=1 Tax=Stegostoma tigrinum TaxID=3053191 RepID=UPI00202AFD26|nr:39S ribosomal protein L35, mitochondrial isoform X2 [Stegostoma tigrinum]
MQGDGGDIMINMDNPGLVIDQKLNCTERPPAPEGILRCFLPLAQKNVARGSSITQLVSRFSTFNLRYIQSPTISTITKLGLHMGSNFTCARKLCAIKSVPSCAINFQQPVRALTYCSLRKGKRKSVRSVVKRFLRLHCGLWVRRKAGYKKRLWKKRPARKRRLRQHVFCNKTQSKMLDKMTTDFWKRRNWYVNNPYQMYHDRTNLKV